jgi:hypothetical protein
MDMREFLKNRSQFSPADLGEYAGLYVAWSPDGTRIIAANADAMKLVAAVKSAGFDPQECVISSVPATDELVLGGGLDE